MDTNSGALIVQAPSTNDTNVVLDSTLRDIKGPVEIPDLWLWLMIGGGVLVLLLVVAGLVFFIWKMAQKKLAPPPPPPPHVRAKRKLREALAKINEPQIFTVLLTDAVRVYLEEQFQLHAPYRTTEEFLHELQ